MLNVSWEDADAYAKWTEAARGTEGRIYPCGNDWETGNLLRNRRFTKPLGSVPGDVSPYGCVDMAGNAWEWCAAAHGV